MVTKHTEMNKLHLNFMLLVLSILFDIAYHREPDNWTLKNYDRLKQNIYNELEKYREIKIL